MQGSNLLDMSFARVTFVQNVQHIDRLSRFGSFTVSKDVGQKCREHKYIMELYDRARNMRKMKLTPVAKYQLDLPDTIQVG